MRSARWGFNSSITAITLVITVFGTGRAGMRTIPEQSVPEQVAEPLAGTLMTGWRAVELYETQAGMLSAEHQRSPDLPGGTALLPDARGLSGGTGNIPESRNSGMAAGSQGGRMESRRGILDGLDNAPSWGWLADDVNAAAAVPEPRSETGFRSLQPLESRGQSQRTDRLGTGLGLGNGEDAFLFQRRQDDRF